MPIEEQNTAGTDNAAETTGTGNNNMNPENASVNETAGTQESADHKVTSLASEAGQQESTGAPETYDFKGSLPEGAELDEETAKEFGDVCRSMNLTNQQANDMAKYGYQYAQKVMQAYADQREAEINSWAEDTKKTLGADFQKTMDRYGAGLAYMEKTVPNIRQVLNETGAGNRIEIVRAISMLGRLISEDPGMGGNAAGVHTQGSLYPNSGDMTM